jgi:protein SCO1/2
MIMRLLCASVMVLAVGTGDCVVEAQRAASSYSGAIVTPPLPKPRFTLTDTSGTSFDFWARTQGYVTLLFFGYASCPSECPLHVDNIARSLKSVPAGVDEHIKLVFVTTDPGRDTPQGLRSWLDHFDRRFVGLTGSDAAIEAAQIAAGVPPARKSSQSGSPAHANFVLAYTTDNLAHVIYPGGITQRDWAHDLPLLVRETWSGR